MIGHDIVIEKSLRSYILLYLFVYLLTNIIINIYNVVIMVQTRSKYLLLKNNPTEVVTEESAQPPYLTSEPSSASSSKNYNRK